MCTIMHNMHRYVPQATHQSVRQGEDLPVDEDFCHGILFGGDRVTVCRSRGAQSARSHDDSLVGWVEGLTAVVEDWHALMRVCLYNS